MLRSWLRIAHRGASGVAPEHTRPAFERALAFGVDMIELDVQLSRDGELVVIHDLDLGRTTSGRGPVRDHDLAALKALDAGSWFDPAFRGAAVLTLDEVLSMVDGRARLNVEIKAPAADWPSLTRVLLRTLRARHAVEATLISCFEPQALAVVRAAAAAARLGLLWQEPDFDGAWRWAQTLGAVSLHPFRGLVTAELVAAAHGRGVQVLAWTANEPAEIRRLVRLGVDGVMSDFPERLAAVESAEGSA